MLKPFVVFLVGCLVFQCHGRKVSFVNPCLASDEACLISSAQAVLPHLTAGAPELGIHPAEPLLIDDVKATEGDLTMHFKNINVTGLAQCKIAKLKIKFKYLVVKPDQEYNNEVPPYCGFSVEFIPFTGNNFERDDHTHLSLVLECPIDSIGQYSISGKLLFLEIAGNGDFEIKLDKVSISIEAQLKKVDGADGVKHWHASKLEHTYEPLGPVYIHLDNLFGGDETKAKPIADIFKSSSNEVFVTFGKPIVTELVEKAKDHINEFFNIVPADEMLLY